MQRIAALMVLTAAFAVPAIISAQDWDRGYRRDGVRILIGRSLAIPATAVQDDAVLVVGGSLTIDGRVEDDVVVIGGRLRVGPTAVVRGDVTTIGGIAEVDPKAQINGEWNQVSAFWPVFGVAWPADAWWWVGFALALTITRFVLVVIVSSVITLVAPRWTREAGLESATAAGASLLTGWAVQILFVPAVITVTVALAFSVIGIPLVAAVPLLFMALALAWVAGFAATAARAGRALRGRAADFSDPSLADTLVGVTLLGLVTFLGHLLALGPAWLMPIAIVTVVCGLTIEYVAWTIGLGAATRTILNRWRGRSPLPQATLQPAQ